MDNETDRELIHMALNLWANYIETGNVTLSARDAQAQRKPVRALERDSLKLVVRLRELAEKLPARL